MIIHKLESKTNEWKDASYIKNLEGLVDHGFSVEFKGVQETIEGQFNLYYVSFQSYGEYYRVRKDDF